MNKKLRKQLMLLDLKEKVQNDRGLDTFEACACDALAVLMNAGLIAKSDTPFKNGLSDWRKAPYTEWGRIVLREVNAILSL